MADGAAALALHDGLLQLGQSVGEVRDVLLVGADQPPGQAPGGLLTDAWKARQQLHHAVQGIGH